jgi:predicted nuclease of predicted toxin-antitoxin system
VKLLFDENLSARLVELLAPEFPGSVHVEQVLGRGRSDAEVWEFARANGYAIASKDNDFRQRAFLSGPPPKVVWLAVGNADTTTIAELLRSSTAELLQLDAESATALLVLGL